MEVLKYDSAQELFEKSDAEVTQQLTHALDLSKPELFLSRISLGGGGSVRHAQNLCSEKFAYSVGLGPYEASGSRRRRWCTTLQRATWCMTWWSSLIAIGRCRRSLARVWTGCGS